MKRSSSLISQASSRPTKRKRYVRVKLERPRTALYRPFAGQTSVVKAVSPVQHLRYISGDTIIGASGVGGYHVYSLNSLFDPDVTGTGHQPMRFDQWKAFYENYIVIGASVKVQYMPIQDDGTDSIPIVWGMRVSRASTGIADYQASAEQDNGPYMITSDRGSIGVQTLTARWSAKKFFNCTSLKDNMDRFGAAVTASPTEQAYLHVFAQDINESVTVTMKILTTIDYHVIFSDPADQDQS